jgi:predicted cobalt transporter CbtA
LAQLRQQGMVKAELYGADNKVLGGLNAFYLLPDKPEVFGLPPDPKLPSRSVQRSAFWAIFTSFLTALGVLFAFRSRTKVRPAVAEAGVPVIPAVGAAADLVSSQSEVDTVKDKEFREKLKKGQEQPKKGAKP